MLQLVRIHNNNPILGEPTCSKNWCKLCEMSWLRQNGFDGRSSIICLPTPRDPDRDPLRAHSSPCATVPYHVPVSSLCHLRHCAVCLCATMRLFCVPLCHAVCHCATVPCAFASVLLCHLPVSPCSVCILFPYEMTKVDPVSIEIYWS